MTHLVRAADAERLTGDPGSVITLLADTEDAAGLLTSNRSLFRAGFDGAPPHVHRRSAELFFVLDGRLDVLVEDRIETLERGDQLVVEPGVVHAFAAAPGGDADVLFVFTPGTARFDYYRLLDAAHRGQAEWAAIPASGERFDNHYAESAVWTARPR